MPTSFKNFPSMFTISLISDKNSHTKRGGGNDESYADQDKDLENTNR